jgi:hypothetical protein
VPIEISKKMKKTSSEKGGRVKRFFNWLKNGAEKAQAVQGNCPT